MTHPSTEVPPSGDAGVDSLEGSTDVGASKSGSTVETTMALLAIPWSLCSAALVAVLLYVNIHNFAVYGAMVQARDSGNLQVGDPSPTHRDLARYTVLSVSLAVVLLHLGASYLLFRHAYLTLVAVGASLQDLALMVEMIRQLRSAVFFFVDSVQRARAVEACGRFWVMEFSPFAEICAAEAALNDVSVRLLPHQQQQSRNGDSSTFCPSPPAPEETGQRDGHDATSSSAASSTIRNNATQRQPSPGLDVAEAPRPPSAPSAVGSAASLIELSTCARPFALTLRRRHVALLQISFLTYRQLVQGEAEIAAQLTNKFISAVLLSARRFEATVVELNSDGALLAWNAFVEAPGEYTQTCVRCGFWLHDHFVKGIREDSGAFFSIAGYAGHVVCGTTSESAHVLHGRPVAVLRELPSLLEQRYCKYVWLGTAPPPPVAGSSVSSSGPVTEARLWGTVLAERQLSLHLYVMSSDSPDEAGWRDGQRPLRVWHAPEWRLFGRETALMSAQPSHHSATSRGPPVEQLEAPPSPPPVSAAPAPPLLRHPLDTFRDRNGTLYQLSNTVLGESKACAVRLAVSHNGTLVAVKEIKIERGPLSPMRRRRFQREKRIVVTPGDQLAWQNEVRIMEQLHHTCIVGYISFQETADTLRIVMEYVGGGNLLKFVSPDAQSATTTTDRPPMEVLLRSVLEGIDFLHRHGILHGDIKPQNVLVPDSGPCKIADFGISRRVSHTATHPIEGTPFYMAPEATRGAATVASDIWSFGIMFAEVLTGRLPYDPAITDSYLIAQFMFGHDVERCLCTPLDAPAYDVFAACTQYDAAQRKTAAELLQMPYFAKKAKGTADARSSD